MFKPVATVFFIIGIVYIIFSIIEIIIFFILRNSLKKLNNTKSVAEAEEFLRHMPAADPFTLAIKYIPFIRHKTAELGVEAFKVKMRHTNIVIAIHGFIVCPIMAMLAMYIAIAFLNFSFSIDSIPSIIASTTDESECTCYVKCTGNEEDDAKCSYELAFGPDEYQTLIAAAHMTPQEKSMFTACGGTIETASASTESSSSSASDSAGENKIPTSGNSIQSISSDSISVDSISVDSFGTTGTLESVTDSSITSEVTEESTESASDDNIASGEENSLTDNPKGKQQGEFLASLINSDMATAYKNAILATNKKFHMKVDGKDRTTMTNDELKADLKALLNEYTVKGRNPLCKECNKLEGENLNKGCKGQKHWTKGWSWSELWPDENGDYPTNPTVSGNGTDHGRATGKYAIALDDGTYYWYHQCASGGCVYCGDWSTSIWNAWRGGDALGKNGCPIYALAIGLSNLVGSEITPNVIMADLGAPMVGNLHDCNNNSHFTIGVGIVRETSAQDLAAKYGVHVEHVDHSIASIDAILDKGGYVWGSWYDPKCDWCSNGTSHFMMIRKKSGTNYYCFTSCRGKKATAGGLEGAIQTMNLPLDKQTCINAMTPMQLYGFWADVKTNPSNPTPINGATIYMPDELKNYPIVNFYEDWQRMNLARDKELIDRTFGWERWMNGHPEFNDKPHANWQYRGTYYGVPEAFDSQGFGRIDGRYVVAVTPYIGIVGTKIDVYYDDGTVLNCIVGDCKGAPQCDWGNISNGNLNVLEFIVNSHNPNCGETWYHPHHFCNPGTGNYIPQIAGKKIVKIVREAPSW